jgi:hypothetical protein
VKEIICLMGQQQEPINYPLIEFSVQLCKHAFTFPCIWRVCCLHQAVYLCFIYPCDIRGATHIRASPSESVTGRLMTRISYSGDSEDSDHRDWHHDDDPASPGLSDSTGLGQQGRFFLSDPQTAGPA